MKVEYTSDGILVSVVTEGNSRIKETFTKGFFRDRLTSRPLDIAVIPIEFEEGEGLTDEKD